MADEIDYKIIGDDMQLVEIELDPGEAVQAEAGAMTYMGPGIQMQTTLGNEGGGLLGGLKKGLKRALTGESFFITSFVHKGSGKDLVVLQLRIRARLYLLTFPSLEAVSSARKMLSFVLPAG